MAEQPDPQLVAAMLAYQQQSDAVRAKLATFIENLWRSLGIYRDAQILPFVRQALPAVLGAQQTMSGLTAANLATQKQLALGGTGRPAAVGPARVTGSAARNGADMNEVYARPFHLVWRQLDELPKQPESIDKAITAGMKRAVSTALNDVQLAKQHTALEIIGHDDKAVGYRRVLEGAHSCGLCIVASTQRYHKNELLPIHGGCDCSVATIWAHADPGQQIASMARVGGRLVHVTELPDLHDRIQARFGASSSAAREIGRNVKNESGDLLLYRDALITHEHGELGPVIAVRGGEFTGPEDIAA